MTSPEPVTEAGRALLAAIEYEQRFGSTASALEVIRRFRIAERAALRDELAAKVEALPATGEYVGIPERIIEQVDRAAVLDLLRGDSQK